MAGQFSTYDPAQVSAIVAGIPLSGFAPGTFITVEQNEDSFSLTTGPDGDSCRAKSNNRSARVTFTLLQSSAVNDLLSALHNLDINSPSGDGIGPFLLKDNSGRTVNAAEHCWIVKPANSSFGGEVENREWTVESDFMNHFVGGN